MSKAHYFYSRLPLKELEKIVEAHQSDFDELIQDTFTEEELNGLERMIDSIAAIYAQPIISEMTFADFYPKESEALKQEEFFEHCKSSVLIDNLPDFHTNPFQVTYLLELLRNFDEVLIDTGGVNELMFKKEYVEGLKKFKNIFSLLPDEPARPMEVKSTKPVDPIDFLILDVYKELDRLSDRMHLVHEQMDSQPEKTRKTFNAMKDERLDASTLLRRSGLNAKDFDDNLERLKFFLKKII